MIVTGNPKEQILSQIISFYGVTSEKVGGVSAAIEGVYDEVIERLGHCFSHVKNKYYHGDGSEILFNPLHTAQWTMFLYYLANTLKLRSGFNTDLCDMIYGISKCFSSADIYYEVKMPDIWFFDHPQGSVMGRAEYSDYFTFSQCCTVGNNKGKYPRFGRHVSMMSGSKILGDCQIGDHVIMSANSYVIDTNVPSNCIVFGSSPNITIRSITLEKFHSLTCAMFDGFE